MIDNDTKAQYLQRINYSGPTSATVATLKALHLAHLFTVPFENLDIALGKKIVLDSDALLNKIITDKRGGFCYELNYTFSLLLEKLGFTVELLAAQVFDKGKFGPPLDHMVLLVECENARWICDVGFGDSFIAPLILGGPEQTQQNSRYKLVHSDEYYELLRAKSEEGWQVQYRFDLISYVLEDYLLMCEYQQTSPESGFSYKSVCSIATKDGRKTISNGRFIDSTGPTRTELPIQSEAQYRQLLVHHFDVMLGQNISLDKLCATPIICS